MSEWHKFENELPPVGKKCIIANSKTSTLSIHTLGYTFQHESDDGWTKVSTAQQIQQQNGYWLEIPPLPEDE